MRREQIERFYEQYGAALVAYGSSLTGSRSTAEDLIQQVFLKLLRENRAEPENPRAYLYRAVRNAALNAMRTAGRETELDLESPWFAARGAPASGSGNSGLELEASLFDLPSEQREAVVMHIWGGLTFEEIAAVLEISANTAASRYRYGLAKLREKLGEKAGDGPRERTKATEVKEHATRR